MKSCTAHRPSLPTEHVRWCLLLEDGWWTVCIPALIYELSGPHWLSGELLDSPFDFAVREAD